MLSFIHELKCVHHYVKENFHNDLRKIKNINVGKSVTTSMSTYTNIGFHEL